MKAIVRIMAIFLALFTLAAAGCAKKVTLTFTNVTGQSADIMVRATGDNDADLVIPGNGGRVKHRLKIEKDDLPATCTVEYGRSKQRFSITKQTPGHLWIDINSDGLQGPRDKSVEIKKERRTESKPVPIRTRTVLEPD